MSFLLTLRIIQTTLTSSSETAGQPTDILSLTCKFPSVSPVLLRDGSPATSLVRRPITFRPFLISAPHLHNSLFHQSIEWTIAQLINSHSSTPQTRSTHPSAASSFPKASFLWTLLISHTWVCARLSTSSHKSAFLTSLSPFFVLS